MSFEIRTLSKIDDQFKKLSRKYPSLKQDLLDFSTGLLKNPLQGDKLGKDCYKVRMKISSKRKGKSGGARVITCVKIVHEQILLVPIYDKSQQGNVSDNFIAHLLIENRFKFSYPLNLNPSTFSFFSI